jgi:D-alanyl-D-alanine carboxypeptidase/D-alanyl-D-alanine-endopeptidase (penicillin-binding protein 4)
MPNVLSPGSERSMRPSSFRPVRSLTPGVVLLLATLLGAIALPTYARPGAKLPAPVLQAFKRARIPLTHVGVLVQETGNGEPLIAWQADRPMNPASTMKLVTTFAGLAALGPTYTWKTEVYGTGVQRGDVLEGDLIIKGYGDPKLSLERFWLLLRGLRQRGIREIRGDLVLDHDHFAVEDRFPVSFDGAPFRLYNTIPTALLLNSKSIQVQVLPKGKGLVQVVTDPRPAQIEVLNQLKPTRGPCRMRNSKFGVRFHSDAASARITASGAYPLACGKAIYEASLLSHTQYVYGVFRQLWGELGGQLRGGLGEGRVPHGAERLALSESPTVVEVVRDINKDSNNVMARQLFLTLGAEIRGPPASPSKAFDGIQGWFYKRGVDTEGLVMENGSGLSRIEQIATSALGHMLLYAYASPTMPEFIASLPLVGVDGTMRKRLRHTPLKGRAHIKTGSLRGVKAIAGYVLNRFGRMTVVVCIINHPNAAAGTVAQDALLRFAYDGADPGPSPVVSARP